MTVSKSIRLACIAGVSRRHILASAASLAGISLLAACTTTNAAGQTIIDPQVLADATGMVNTLIAELPVLLSIDKTLLSTDTQNTVTTALTAAQTALSKLSTGTLAASGASTLQIAEGAINTALSVLLPALSTAAALYPALSVAVPIVTAVAALLPAVEAYVNTLIPSSTPAVAAIRAKAVAPTITRAMARKTLNIRVVTQ